MGSLLVSLCSIELNFFSTNIENLPLFSLTIISFKIYNINRCNSLLGYSMRPPVQVKSQIPNPKSQTTPPHHNTGPPSAHHYPLQRQLDRLIWGCSIFFSLMPCQIRALNSQFSTPLLSPPYLALLPCQLPISREFLHEESLDLWIIP